MKLFSIFVFGLFAATSVFAADQVMYVTGNGYASDYCTANSSYFCMDNAKRRAESDAQMDAQRQCDYQSGQLDSTFGCNTSCNPYYIPPDSPGTWVNCNSSCTLPCRIPDNH